MFAKFCESMTVTVADIHHYSYCWLWALNNANYIGYHYDSVVQFDIQKRL